LTASIKSFVTFSNEMSQDLAEKFNSDFTSEYMKRKIIYKTRCNNNRTTSVLDLYTVLVISARKPHTHKYNIHNTHKNDFSSRCI